MSAPLISVLLPVYNAESFIRDSIQSVLDQTLPDFELIVIDDGSKDNSAEMVESIRDPRIRFYRQENKGMGATLNYAISLARGQFLARQDADDISLAERFARQVTFLNAHTDHALAGTAAVIVNEKLGETGRRHSPAEKHRDLCFDLLFDNPFVHSSVMMRADAIKQTGAYDLQKASLIQDYDLWWRIAQKFR
ncbi:MAG TPA: glycosyltransferase, partial [Bacteroidia bacterium]|nr:glycosyltransferase [Bacteroidia bacterium]